MKYPDMIRIRQLFQTTPIPDIAEETRKALAQIRPEKIILPGEKVAITAGSRGVANIATVLAELVRKIKKIGAHPFIIPAMGSHGGATADGQKKVLAHYGITETTMDAPIKASMDVDQVGETSDGIPVYVDHFACQADRIVIVNRVKPHTDFKGKIESGLIKMMAIGLGKQKGADHYHNVIVRLGHYRVFTSVAEEIMKQCPIAFGLALVENQRDETEIIRAMPTAEIEMTEQQLLLEAKRRFPRIPFSPIDLLIVDWMGKEISGTGMDQNVIGRSVIPYHHTDTVPAIMRIFVRDLTPDSGGNAIGIGNADFTTRRLVEQIDPQAIYMNAITSSCPEAARIPPCFDNDREAVEAALKTIGEVGPEAARIVHIRDTLHLEEMNISAALVSEARNATGLEVIGSHAPLVFNTEGNLVSEF
jgi:hypothetical protein